MPEKSMKGAGDIRQMSFDEKLGLLSQKDKDYLEGYIDRALLSAGGKREARKISAAGQESSGGPSPKSGPARKAAVVSDPDRG